MDKKQLWSALDHLNDGWASLEHAKELTANNSDSLTSDLYEAQKMITFIKGQIVELLYED